MSTLLQDARAFAAEAHKGQTYDGGSFLLNRLDRVVLTLVRFGETRP